MIRDFSCLFCLLLFLISAAVHIVSIINYAKIQTNILRNDDWLALEPQFLEELWIERANARLLQVDMSIFSALAWFSFVIPVTQTAFLLSEGGTRLTGLHISIVALVLGASMSELLSHMMNIGMNGAIRWMVNDFNLSDWGVSANGVDGVGYRVVEILHILSKGIVVWVDSFEWLALSAITFFICLSIKNDSKETPTFSSYFGGLSAVITLCSFVTFACNVFQLTQFHTWVPLILTTLILNAFILLPLWLWYLSTAIPAAKARYEVRQTEENGEEVEITTIS